MSDDQRRDAAPPPAAGDSGAASPPADEPFDAIAAVAELEAAMQAADAQQQDSAADSGQHRAQIEARDRQIAELERIRKEREDRRLMDAVAGRPVELTPAERQRLRDLGQS